MTDSGFQQKRGRFTKLASTTAAVCGISFSESAQNVQKLRQIGRLHFVHANFWAAMQFSDSRTVGGGKIADVSKLGCPGTWRRRERLWFFCPSSSMSSAEKAFGGQPQASGSRGLSVLFFFPLVFCCFRLGLVGGVSISFYELPVS